MRKKRVVFALFVVLFAFLIMLGVGFAQKKAPEPTSIKLEGGKLGPVSFSHITHTEKVKIECVACHHKDKDPKEPEACVKCHLLKEVKDNAPPAKDAFHKNCVTCHKESTDKGKAAPTKCNDCHKK